MVPNDRICVLGVCGRYFSRYVEINLFKSVFHPYDFGRTQFFSTVVQKFDTTHRQPMIYIQYMVNKVVSFLHLSQ